MYNGYSMRLFRAPVESRVTNLRLADFFFFFFYLTILQPDITGYRGRKKSTFYIIFSQFFYYTKIKNDNECEGA